jgi:hypothetical protein
MTKTVLNQGISFPHPKQFPDGILNSGSLWHQLGPIFRQKLWLVDSAVPLSSSVEVRKSASHNEIEDFDS